jgi:cytochrome c-type biogenesis protein CcmE
MLQEPMTDLDQELADAVKETEGNEASEAGVVKAASPGESSARLKPQKRNWGLLAALLVIGGGILSLMLTSAEDASIYAIKVDQLMSEKQKFENRTVRAQGYLVKGSLMKREDPCEYRFRIHNNLDEKQGPELAVRYSNCVVPDTFRDVPNIDVEVTAEGKLAGNGGEYLEASHIMAKCPSKYEMKELAEKGEAAPHAAVPAPTVDPLSPRL